MLTEDKPVRLCSNERPNARRYGVLLFISLQRHQIGVQPGGALFRAGFASRVSSPVMTDLVLGMKRALDPHNVLGARNNLLAAEPPTADGVKADT